MKRILTPLALAAVAALSLTACGGTESPAMSPSAMEPSQGMSMEPSQGMSRQPSSGTSMQPSGMMSDSMSKPGTFITYDAYQADKASHANTTTVLFFNASWCPQCKAMTDALTKDPALVPAGVTLVSVDYDSHTDLRKKYGVTMQHTFVQLDDSGNRVAKWSATSASDIGSGIKKG